MIGEYGYWALLIGTFLEGETILLVAGFLAHGGTLDLSFCILAAFVGSLSGDQAAFYVGRWKGKQFVDKRPAWKCRVDRVHQMLERFHEALILSFRFFYGLRNLTPFILGTTDISGIKFFLLNAVGAAIWAVSFGCAGYFFGTLVASVLKDVHHIEMILLIVVVLALLLAWFFRRRKRRKVDQACLANLAQTDQETPPEGGSRPGGSGEN
ncbi:DedA family protein [Fundidesulfovibrio terrae]|uniref:DedA family protein n=1 Tax=Fundidesulfovibrio terrae TaxID=2922866 RepID=UPI001FB044BB